MKAITWTPKHPDTTGWKARHTAAIAAPQAAERPIVDGLKAWIDYAAIHSARYQSKIGDDGVLGPAWAQWGDAIRQLLNGEVGRLDCGTLDTIISDNLITQGLDPNQL